MMAIVRGQNYLATLGMVVRGQQLTLSVAEIFYVILRRPSLYPDGTSTTLIVVPGAQATACAIAHCFQSDESAFTRCSISASVCNGPGVMRRRSVPLGTVG